eukprot:3437777-Rhodomonas_salina.3
MRIAGEVSGVGADEEPREDPREEEAGLPRAAAISSAIPLRNVPNATAIPLQTAPRARLFSGSGRLQR